MAADRAGRGFLVLGLVGAQLGEQLQRLPPVLARRLGLAEGAVRMAEAVVRAGQVGRLAELAGEFECPVMLLDGCGPVAGRVVQPAQALLGLELPVPVPELVGVSRRGRVAWSGGYRWA